MASPIRSVTTENPGPPATDDGVDAAASYSYERPSRGSWPSEATYRAPGR
jgi:hypothetical protein